MAAPISIPHDTIIHEGYDLSVFVIQRIRKRGKIDDAIAEAEGQETPRREKGTACLMALSIRIPSIASILLRANSLAVIWLKESILE
jgi:hypothetical protein